MQDKQATKIFPFNAIESSAFSAFIGATHPLRMISIGVDFSIGKVYFQYYDGDIKEIMGPRASHSDKYEFVSGRQYLHGLIRKRGKSGDIYVSGITGPVGENATIIKKLVTAIDGIYRTQFNNCYHVTLATPPVNSVYLVGSGNQSQFFRAQSVELSNDGSVIYVTPKGRITAIPANQIMSFIDSAVTAPIEVITSYDATSYQVEHIDAWDVDTVALTLRHKNGNTIIQLAGIDIAQKDDQTHQMVMDDKGQIPYLIEGPIAQCLGAVGPNNAFIAAITSRDEKEANIVFQQVPRA